MTAPAAPPVAGTVVTAAEVLGRCPPRPAACHRCAGAGGHVLGHLCLPCARLVVAGWSSAMGPTVAAMPDELRRVLGVDPENGARVA